MWIFGYGSLIWKVDFPYNRKISGYITGYVRRFYQASTDHRGVPEKPGRVVTLIPTGDENDEVWGVAYEIPDDQVDEVVGHLDTRERCGYAKTEVRFHSGPGQPPAPAHVFAYISTAGNEWFVGEEPLDAIALKISESCGPSGSNAEYLFQLADAMRSIAPHRPDHHLFQLENRVRALLRGP